MRDVVRGLVREMAPVIVTVAGISVIASSIAALKATVPTNNSSGRSTL